MQPPLDAVSTVGRHVASPHDDSMWLSDRQCRCPLGAETPDARWSLVLQGKDRTLRDGVGNYLCHYSKERLE